LRLWVGLAVKNRGKNVTRRNLLSSARLYSHCVNRRTDHDDRVFRRLKHRISSEGGQWFYQTREGVRGPFKTKRLAETDLRLYVGTMEFVDTSSDCIPKDVDSASIEFVDIPAPDWSGPP
jgi:hypothetical protein